jgi:hypothetical protein
MLELTMATFRLDAIPAVSLQAFDDVANLHTFSPEVHNLHGDGNTTLAKLEGPDSHLKDRRACGFIIETNKGSAQMLLVNKANKGDMVWTVCTFSFLVRRPATNIRQPFF